MRDKDGSSVPGSVVHDFPHEHQLVVSHGSVHPVVYDQAGDGAA